MNIIFLKIINKMMVTSKRQMHNPKGKNKTEQNKSLI